MTIIEHITVDFIFLKGAMFTALLSLFLDFCFREGMILQGWLPMISNWWLSKNDPDSKYWAENNLKGKSEEVCLTLTDGEYDSELEYKYDKTDWIWFKPLGYCVVCMNVWISVIYGSVYFFWEFPVKFIGMILLSSFLTRLLYGKLL